MQTYLTRFVVHIIIKLLKSLTFYFSLMTNLKTKFKALTYITKSSTKNNMIKTKFKYISKHKFYKIL